MKLYKNIMKEKGLLAKVQKVYWTTELPERASIVKDRKEVREYKVLYSMEFDIQTDLSMNELMNIMYHKLSLKEIKEICEANENINKIFIRYIQKKAHQEENNQASEDIKLSIHTWITFMLIAMLSWLLILM